PSRPRSASRSIWRGSGSSSIRRKGCWNCSGHGWSIVLSIASRRPPATSMRFDLLTIFPEFFAGPFDCGIIRRAREQGIIEIAVHDLRSFTFDKHHIVDDRPFGGGDGMVLKPEPLFRAVEAL